MGEKVNVVVCQGIFVSVLLSSEEQFKPTCASFVYEDKTKMHTKTSGNVISSNI